MKQGFGKCVAKKAKDHGTWQTTKWKQMERQSPNNGKAKRRNNKWKILIKMATQT
jgi:hypothetical protein